jgi:hypothetical protein
VSTERVRREVSTQIHRLGAGCCWPHHGYVTLLARAPRIRNLPYSYIAARVPIFTGWTGTLGKFGARPPSAALLGASILPGLPGTVLLSETRYAGHVTAQHHHLTCGSSGGTSMCDPAINRCMQVPDRTARRGHAAFAGWCSSAARCCSLRSQLRSRGGSPTPCG